MSEQEKHGPHGGPMVELSDGFVELSVFETGAPPRFRLYFFDRARAPVAPRGAAEVNIETVRPDKKAQSFVFKPGDGYIESTTDIPEPHEFTVTVQIDRAEGVESHAAKFTEEILCQPNFIASLDRPRPRLVRQDS